MRAVIGFISILFVSFLPVKDGVHILFLGDSYTIGQSISPDERFPEQTISLLEKKEIACSEPVIIARTGWATQNLIHAIEQKNLQQQFDFVTLLIGVNDQYQGISSDTYEKNFTALLQTAIGYAHHDPSRVIVISIPDYSVTPFAQDEEKTASEIAAEIDLLNAINLRIAKQNDVKYINITEISRKAKDDLSLLADDGLHPSAKMYAEWASLIAGEIATALH